MKAEELRELIREVLKEQEAQQSNVGDKSATKLKTGSMSASQRVKTSRERIKIQVASLPHKNKRL